MPWSDSHSYVYVAVPKTGSTSMVSVLQAMHRAEGGELLLRHGAADTAFRERYRLDEIGDPQPGRVKHLSALQLRYVLGERFDTCFRFSLVRNPWARTASRYRYNHADFNRAPPKEEVRKAAPRKRHDLDFPDWMRRRWERWSTGRMAYRSQLSKLVDAEGNLIVDYVGKLETFQESLDTVCDRVGVPRQPARHVNRTADVPYASLYDDETREMVRVICEEDIQAFGYEF